MHNIFKTIPELVKGLQILLKLRCHSVGLTCVGTNECIPLKLKEKKIVWSSNHLVRKWQPSWKCLG